MIEQGLLNGDLSEILSKIQNDLSYGLLYTQLMTIQRKPWKSASLLYALIELLNEKGIISIEELDERKKQVAERLLRKLTKSGIWAEGPGPRI